MAKKPKHETEKPTMLGDQHSDIDPVVSSSIGKQLKRMYDEVLDEPVPDRFAKLLEQLADREQTEK